MSSSTNTSAAYHSAFTTIVRQYNVELATFISLLLIEVALIIMILRWIRNLLGNMLFLESIDKQSEEPWMPYEKMTMPYEEVRFQELLKMSSTTTTSATSVSAFTTIARQYNVELATFISLSLIEVALIIMILRWIRNLLGSMLFLESIDKQSEEWWMPCEESKERWMPYEKMTMPYEEIKFQELLKMSSTTTTSATSVSAFTTIVRQYNVELATFISRSLIEEALVIMILRWIRNLLGSKLFLESIDKQSEERWMPYEKMTMPYEEIKFQELLKMSSTTTTSATSVSAFTTIARQYNVELATFISLSLIEEALVIMILRWIRNLLGGMLFLESIDKQSEERWMPYEEVRFQELLKMSTDRRSSSNHDPQMDSESFRKHAFSRIYRQAVKRAVDAILRGEIPGVVEDVKFNKHLCCLPFCLYNNCSSIQCRTHYLYLTIADRSSINNHDPQMDSNLLGRKLFLESIDKQSEERWMPYEKMTMPYEEIKFQELLRCQVPQPPLLLPFLSLQQLFGNTM
ncbi:hypothetical protein FQA39_LY05989 [Lamprigera yunnana]|nr:hypothetical protein FQA39_LY05989 [Lamprigera yunnana]